MPASAEGPPRPARGITAMLPSLLDFIVPLVAYYALTAAGIWVLASSFIGRPVTIDATKPFAARKGGADGIAAVEWLAALWITEIPGIIVIGICLIASRQAGKRLKALVNDRMKQSDRNAAPQAG